jgi:hypothetical protein
MTENETPEGVEPELPITPQYGVGEHASEAASQALPQLRRPFAPAAIKWKVQASNYRPKKDGRDAVDATWAIIVGYIDARLVIDRLNMVCGFHWAEEPIRVADRKDALLYKLTVFGQTHIDVGIEQGATDGMRLKAVHSDALKRTAVRFGVGVSLYAVPQIMIDVTAKGGENSEGVPSLGRNYGKPGRLKPVHHAYFRKVYAEWLVDTGIEAFGEVLSHGDAEESAGELVDGPDEAEPESAAPARQVLEDAQAQALREKLGMIREEIRQVDPDALPDASFDNALTVRGHDHALLEEFVGKLEELRTSAEVVDALRVEVEEKLAPAAAKKALEHAARKSSRSEKAEILQAAIDKADEGSN